jgi:dienelactone hydrolase
MAEIGSLYPFIASQVPKRFPGSFLESKDELTAWTARGRRRVFELLEYEPPRCDHRSTVLESVACDGYRREKILFNTTPDIRVPAYVLIPDGLKKPAPAIVALHDHGAFYLWGKEKLVAIDGEHPALTKFRGDYYAGRAIACDLARQGYVVIVIDMFYWGERRMLLEGDAADWRERDGRLQQARIDEFNSRANGYEDTVARSIFTAGFTWSGVMSMDDIRTVDYLTTRPEVDPTRIGCVGLSVGAYRSVHLAALDERIKASVAIGWMASFPAQLENHINSIGFCKLVPGLYREMDLPDVASLAMPSARLLINGTRDGLFALDGVRASFDKIAACYRKAGIAERFRGSLYDSPHEFNAAMQHEAWEWFRRWL